MHCIDMNAVLSVTADRPDFVLFDSIARLGTFTRPFVRRHSCARRSKSARTPFLREDERGGRITCSADRASRATLEANYEFSRSASHGSSKTTSGLLRGVLIEKRSGVLVGPPSNGTSKDDRFGLLRTRSRERRSLRRCAGRS